MIKLNKRKQIIDNKQQILDSREEQPLLFSLIHLIVYSIKNDH